MPKRRSPPKRVAPSAECRPSRGTDAQDRLSPRPRASRRPRKSIVISPRRATSSPSFDSVDELKELLVALPPHLVIVDAAFDNALDEIGALVKRARAEVSERIWLIALSDDSDLPKRLRAVRAGCDAFIALPANAADVIARIGELIETERTNPYRIMIVEDDRSQTLFAESILRKAGMETLAINEGLSALDELDRFRPELILMDLYMPDVDGMELTALIREREAFISTPIVFLSGEQRRGQAFRSAERGRRRFPVQADPAQASDFRGHQPRASRAPDVLAPVGGGGFDERAVRRRHGVARCVAAASRRMARDGRRAHARRRTCSCSSSKTAPHCARVSARRAASGCSPKSAASSPVTPVTAIMVARDGASGFLLLNSDREVAALEGYAANIRDRLARETFAAAEGAARLLLDAGVCAFRDSGGDALAMLNAAKAAVATARKEGRHGVFLVHDANTTNDAELARQIRFALDGAGLQILFQPIVSLHGEEHEQFQALLRLQGDDGRQYVAAELVPVAERAGLIAEIDRWVFAAVRRDDRRTHGKRPRAAAVPEPVAGQRARRGAHRLDARAARTPGRARRQHFARAQRRERRRRRWTTSPLTARRSSRSASR